MKGKKILFLSLALLLPVAVFIFLKFFGKNEFSVPLLYQEGVADVSANCNVQYAAPYVLPDSVVQNINQNPSVIIIDFNERPSAEMRAIKDEFKNDPVVIRSYSSVNFADKNFIRDCVLLMKAPNTIVMIDDQKRIRGYYENNREEIDRLAVELKIVLKKY